MLYLLFPFMFPAIVLFLAMQSYTDYGPPPNAGETRIFLSPHIVCPTNDILEAIFDHTTDFEEVATGLSYTAEYSECHLVDHFDKSVTILERKRVGYVVNSQFMHLDAWVLRADFGEGDIRSVLWMEKKPKLHHRHRPHH